MPTTETVYISGLVFKELDTTLGVPIDLASICNGCIGVAFVFDSKESAEAFGGDAIAVASDELEVEK